jgi:poly(beta-D-mannuronate) lyase
MKNVLLCALAFAFCGAKASTFNVGNISEFNKIAKSVQPGDSIILADTVWKDVELKLKANGTKGKPIVLTVKTPGKCTFEGISNLRISGEYLIVDGLIFINGHAPLNKPVIDFRTSNENFAYNSIVRNCVVYNYNQSQKNQSDHWVEMWGKNNTLEYCYLAGKRNLGTTLVIWPNGEKHAPNYHKVYRNYFGERPVLGSNGGETIRIGTSKYSMIDSYSQIEENYFEHCNGETEIISVKSGKNKIVNNTFFECEGSIVLRHGNNNEVCGNYIIGNGKPNTGGIRIINVGHKIYNNYLSGIKGKDFRSPLVVMNGVPNSPINRYHKVRNVEIAYNTFYDCGKVFHLCVGSDAERTEIPENVEISNNIAYSPDETEIVNKYDDIKGFTFNNNLFIGRNGAIKEYGSTGMNYSLERTKEGFMTVMTGLVSNEYDYVDRDINGKKRPVEKHIGAFETLTGTARRFIPNQTNSGPKFGWEKPDNSVKAKKNIYKIEAGTNTLYSAIKKSSSGDIIELAAGKYINDKKLTISHDLIIRASAECESMPEILIDDKKSNTITVFSVTNGATLKLDGLSIVGKDEHIARNAKYAILLSEGNTLENYNLFINNCVIRDFNESGGTAIMARKNTFCDTISISNSMILNSFRGIALDREKETPGLYNAEYMYIYNSKFSSITQWALNFYRGGNDESTLGGHLMVNHCVFDNVNNTAKQYVFKQVGLVTCDIRNSLFINSPNSNGPIKLEDESHSIMNCCLINSGKVNSKKGVSSNIFYDANSIEAKATDGENIGLIIK